MHNIFTTLFRYSNLQAKNIWISLFGGEKIKPNLRGTAQKASKRNESKEKPVRRVDLCEVLEVCCLQFWWIVVICSSSQLLDLKECDREELAAVGCNLNSNSETCFQWKWSETQHTSERTRVHRHRGGHMKPCSSTLPQRIHCSSAGSQTGEINLTSINKLERSSRVENESKRLNAARCVPSWMP